MKSRLIFAALLLAAIPSLAIAGYAHNPQVEVNQTIKGSSASGGTATSSSSSTSTSDSASTSTSTSTSGPSSASASNDGVQVHNNHPRDYNPAPAVLNAAPGSTAPCVVARARGGSFGKYFSLGAGFTTARVDPACASREAERVARETAAAFHAIGAIAQAQAVLCKTPSSLAAMSYEDCAQAIAAPAPSPASTFPATPPVTSGSEAPAPPCQAPPTTASVPPPSRPKRKAPPPKPTTICVPPK